MRPASPDTACVRCDREPSKRLGSVSTEIAAATGVSFACDVVLNRDKEIISAFGGELFAMHAAACAEAKVLAMRAVPAPFEVVVTTNSGWPLDQNLYQAVKGMSAAAQVVRPGGVIVAAAECRDGFPEHGGYRELLGAYPDMAALLADIEGPAREHP